MPQLPGFYILKRKCSHEGDDLTPVYLYKGKCVSILLVMSACVPFNLHWTIRNDDLSATQHNNVVATLFQIAATLPQHYLQHCIALNIVVTNRLV